MGRAGMVALLQAAGPGAGLMGQAWLVTLLQAVLYFDMGL